MLVSRLKAEGLQNQAGWMQAVLACLLWFFFRGLFGISGTLHQTLDQWVVNLAILSACVAVSWIVVAIALHRIQGWHERRRRSPRA